MLIKPGIEVCGVFGSVGSRGCCRKSIPRLGRHHHAQGC